MLESCFPLILLSAHTTKYLNFLLTVHLVHEVGVRKVIGAKRYQLVTQFLIESALTILLSMIIAFVLVMIMKPSISYIIGIPLANELWNDVNFWLLVFCVFCITTFLAGLYPALMLSSFKAVKVLKSKNSFTSKSTLRQFLVVMQFATSIVLLVGTTIVYKQLSYMERNNPRIAFSILYVR